MAVCGAAQFEVIHVAREFLRGDTMELDLKQLLDILRDYQQTSLTLWSIYIGVISGLLGYAIAGKGALKPAVRCLLIVVFLLHAGGNVSFLERNQRLLHALSVEIAFRAPAAVISADLREELKNLPQRQSSSILGLHLVVDAVVIILIWVAPMLASKHGRDTKERS